MTMASTATTGALRLAIILAMVGLFAASTPGVARAQTPWEAFKQATSDRDYARAEQLARAGLNRAIRENRQLGIAGWGMSLGEVYTHLGRYKEAETLLKSALEISERTAVADPKDSYESSCHLQLAHLYIWQDRHAEAETHLRAALKISRAMMGPNSIKTSIILTVMGTYYLKMGRLEDAEDCYAQAAQIEENSPRAMQPWHANCLVNLGNVFRSRGRAAEAERYLKAGLAIHERQPVLNDLDLALAAGFLATLYIDTSRYAEAEILLKRALSIQQKIQRGDRGGIVVVLEKLGSLYTHEGRYADAMPILRWLVENDERKSVPELGGKVEHVQNLARALVQQGQLAEAEGLLDRALAIQKNVRGGMAWQEASICDDLSHLYEKQGKPDRAEVALKRSLSIKEALFGARSFQLASDLGRLGGMYLSMGRGDEAKEMLDRAVSLSESSGTTYDTLNSCYIMRSLLLWETGRRDEAMADIRRSLELVEYLRGNASGAELERADALAKFSFLFEMMVDRLAASDSPKEAFAAIERFHARSLLDDLRTAGTDLEAGRTPDEIDRLRESGSRLRTQLAILERKLQEVDPNAQPAEAKRLQEEASQARRALYAFERDKRSSSPIYRDLITKRAEMPDLEGIQRDVLRPGDLMLVYLLGGHKGYVLALGKDSVRIVPLNLDADGAATLGVQPGPLTSRRLFEALIREDQSGVLQLLANPGAVVPHSKLSALWRGIVPEPERAALTSGNIKRLFVVPDGPLALLPFEALVVEEGNEPKYLLDDGPPIAYGPSATVLYNLAERPTSPTPAGREPVLTVGDPAYGESGAASSMPDSALADLTARARYGGARGRLGRLPFSGTEMSWVAKDFLDAGIGAVTLTRDTATERGVRYWSSGRRVLHLACHGLADQEYGNFFGALALTPGPKGATDPSDDGFLTLPEIYELNLKGTELAILSACQTNYGPQQKGEGTWALSRGFLVAGARRVVASNWLVDDEAAASLVSVFCTGLARAEKKGEPADYSGSLREAKRWVRKQDRWKAPYYWASLVLVGPS